MIQIDMDMPKSCGECKKFIDEDGYCILQDLSMTQSEWDDYTWHEQYKACPLHEVKTGHWKRISMDKYSEHAKHWYRCDRCGKDNLGNTDWCPNCGCRMVKPQADKEKEE